VHAGEMDVIPVKIPCHGHVDVTGIELQVDLLVHEAFAFFREVLADPATVGAFVLRHFGRLKMMSDLHFDESWWNLFEFRAQTQYRETVKTVKFLLFENHKELRLFVHSLVTQNSIDDQIEVNQDL
jgi:hypothetical protein